MPAKEISLPIVVVEGKSDEAKILSILTVEIIKTGGSALSKETLSFIEKCSQQRKVYLLLDPDKAGQRISSRIKEKVSNCWEILLDPRISPEVETYPTQLLKKAIQDALGKAWVSKKISLLMKDYLSLPLNSKSSRNHLCSQLQIPYFNHKQLFKKLNMLGMTLERVDSILKRK